MAERTSTPPRRKHSGSLPSNPLTPEQVRRTEEARLRAKALRQRDEAAYFAAQAGSNATAKRPFASISATPSNQRDARSGQSNLVQPKDDGIRPAKKFQKTDYIEYDFSSMTDTKGGFLSATDDPHNKAMAHAPTEEKPANMTAKEWERHQLLKKLRNQRAGPFEPGISIVSDVENKCRECGSLEIDWKWQEIFGLSVCNPCKDKVPEKYSLLTKTEAREDYLLTEPELKDPKLLPHLERPNPHKSTWNNMQLYLRCQVEEYAFSDRKWGSPEALDAEYERRQVDTKKRKEKKFQEKLKDLKKRTLFDAHRRERATLLKGTDKNGSETVTFGQKIEGGKHVHEWGRSIENPETGMSSKRCVECGMEVEELEF